MNPAPPVTMITAVASDASRHLWELAASFFKNVRRREIPRPSGQSPPGRLDAITSSMAYYCFN